MAAHVGLTGLVTSWANNSHLIGAGVAGSKPSAFTLNLEADEFDTTPFTSGGAVYTSHLSGLRSITGEIRTRIDGAKLGNTGLITFSSGYVVGAKSYNLNLSATEHETTAFNATAPVAKTWIPGLLSWEGSYRCNHDDTTAAAQVGGIASASAVFRTIDDSTDHTLTGNIITTRGPITVQVGELAEIEYAFKGDGALAVAGTGTWTSPFVASVPANVANTAGSLVLQAVTSRTFTFSAFWTRIAIEVAVGQPITFVVGFRGSGDVTIG